MAKRAVKQTDAVPAAVRVPIPIHSRRGGLIRLLNSKEAPAKPKERYMYDVLALLIVESGTAVYVVDNMMVELPPLSMMWCFPDQQRTLCKRTADLKLWVVEFTPDFLVKTCSEDMNINLRAQSGLPLYRGLPAAEFKAMQRILRELLELPADIEHDLFNGGLHYILLHCWRVYRTTIGELQVAELHPAVAKAVHCIRDEGDIESSIPDLAGRCGISASRMTSLFHKEVGMTITEFRNRQKLNRFIDTYSPNGPYTIMTGALNAGFGSYAQFFRIFKDIIGVPPSDYYA